MRVIVVEAPQQQKIEYAEVQRNSFKALLRDKYSIFHIPTKLIDDAIVLTLRNKRVRDLTRRFDTFVDMAREHKSLAALTLLDVDFPIAFPIAFTTANSLYNIPKQVLLPIEVLDLAILFGIEYGIVNGALKVYDRAKWHIAHLSRI